MRFLMEHGFEFFGQRVAYAELIGQLGALAVVFLAQRRTLWTWPVQIVTAVLLFSVYLSAQLGGLATRQVAVLAIAVYGWWAWTRRRDPVFGVAVRAASTTERLVILGLMLVGTTGFALLLEALDASWAPWPDAWIFVGTLVAYGAQAAGLVEFWLVWLAVDAVGVPLQLMSGLWFSALVYIVFAVLVVRGWLDWNRTAAAARNRMTVDTIG
ncbi:MULTISPECIES: nicotinamide mononucleotide transporter family protein [unclassified Crossiella]|uniref:nicotinamide mononucleotide transporter family protein n=1 Tax=unclassified Crossiella TaxID=2620835 RepID=UPI001FFF425D|nr:MULTISPECIES: nicotinamide mononucleotide transporter family protein [unclassified Crossiella]MCK2240794.1 nicotinamide mononucleotide transporter family protein [Crossiella sp. S99.2]MCK2254062.1 nicotinamide mononucleotide transporter family protein [Crossiella sp. S99.1]